MLLLYLDRSGMLIKLGIYFVAYKVTTSIIPLWVVRVNSIYKRQRTVLQMSLRVVYHNDIKNDYSEKENKPSGELVNR